VPIKTRCPNTSCAQINAVDPSQVKSRVKCPKCGTRYVAESTVLGDGPPADVPMATPAQVENGICRFVVKGKLGAGAFGTVYRAYDPHLDREVALKVPHPAVLESPKKVERFLREAKAAARLRHPHIVPVFDAGTDGGRPYIATAFINGRPLSEAIEEGGMEYDRAARIARELAEALAYAHEQGIVHRDVKPHNIMLDEQDHAHLMDFGLASRADEAAKLTNDGAILGTPAYMSPEQAAGHPGEATPAMDQYAAGVVLYEMLTGKVPFEGAPAAVLFKVLNEEPPPITLVRKRISKDLDTICRKAMAKRAGDRYPDCQRLAEDLIRWNAGELVRAANLGAWHRVKLALRRPVKSPRMAGLTLSMAAVVVFGLILAMRSPLLQKWPDGSKEQEKGEVDTSSQEGPEAASERCWSRFEARLRSNDNCHLAFDEIDGEFLPGKVINPTREMPAVAALLLAAKPVDHQIHVGAMNRDARAVSGPMPAYTAHLASLTDPPALPSDRLVELALLGVKNIGQNPWSHYVLGMAYLRCGRWSEAITSFNRSIQMNWRRSDILSRIGRAIALCRTGDLEVAHQLWLEATLLARDLHVDGRVDDPLASQLPFYDAISLKLMIAEGIRTIGPIPVVLSNILPTSERSAQTWKFSTWQPPSEWVSHDFADDGWAWSSGKAGFGAGYSTYISQRTDWSTKNIWLRKTFVLSRPPKGPIVVRIQHDEDAEVYINGSLVIHVTGYSGAYRALRVRPVEAEVLRDGSNLIAVHCTNSGGGQFIDVGLVELAPEP
jgi:predicted Ser/Thr protein kinase